MTHLFLKIIGKISECFLAEDKELNFNEVLKYAEFILAIVNKMQPVYKFGILALIFYFNFAALISRGRVFANLSLAGRIKIVGNWSKSIFGPKRDFIKLLLNLAVIAYYDSENVLKKNGVNTAEYLKIQRLYNGF